jgi:nitroreductase
MEFQDVVRRRRMVRNFEDQPIPAEVLDRILGNALHAPSAGFSQGWAFVVLEGAEQTERFWDASFGDDDRSEFTYDGLFRAPVVVICLSHKQAYLDRYAEPDKGWTDKSEARWPVPYWDIDTGMASLLMLLTPSGWTAYGTRSGSPAPTRPSVPSRSATPPPTRRRRHSSAGVVPRQL